jgi:hypothetical protein
VQKRIFMTIKTKRLHTMKKGALISLFFLGLIILISSCSKTSLDQPGFPGLRCNPGNIEYIADTAYYTRNPRTTIYAKTGNNNRIIIYLNLDTTGTVALSQNGNTAYYLDGVNTYVSTAGSVTITHYFNDSLGVIDGSFGFNARVANDTAKTINVSYGYFNGIPRH